MKTNHTILIVYISVLLFNSLVYESFSQDKTEIEKKTVKITVQSASLPSMASVFIVGNHIKLGSWNPWQTPLIENADGSWSGEFEIEKGYKLEYKFTLSGWEAEALNDDESVPPNEMLTVDRDTAIIHIIKHWKGYTGESPPVFKIAHLQLLSKLDDLEYNAAKAARYCRTADSLGADLALLPEGFFMGFRTVDTGQKEYSITKDHPFVKQFAKLASELDMAITFPFSEKEDGKIYNSVLLIDRFGKIVLTYRKVHLWELGGPNAAVTPGTTFNVCELNTKIGIIKIGAMICSDYYFPESARILMLNGAEIVIVPNSAPINEHVLTMLKARAIENCMGIALTNPPVSDISGFSNQTGKSSAFSPFLWGRYSLLTAGENEGVYISEFEIEKIREQRKTTYFGNAFRHPGVYRAIINTVVNEPFKGRKNGLGQDFTKEKRINYIKDN